CDASLLRGGFHTPTGAIVDALHAGELMRGRAEQRGALSTFAETEVLDLRVEAGRIRTVVTDRGEIDAEHVVIACGVWSPRVAALAGARIPLAAAVHQMVDVGPIPELARTAEWISFPLLRDMDCLMYERQRGPDLEIGSYAHRPLLHLPEEIPPVGDHPGQATPTSFPFTEEDFTEQWEHAKEMFPALLTDPEPPRRAGGRDARGARAVVGGGRVDQGGPRGGPHARRAAHRRSQRDRPPRRGHRPLHPGAAQRRARAGPCRRGLPEDLRDHASAGA